MIQDKGGIFDVKVDEQLVFSKHEVDRFPNDGEVVTAIEGLSA